ncbi:DUF397 domain-containing protein [Patescibacteria group bacterium]|nr:DUF397 domain-containing protein [Patescibacteria group bacterium]MCG2695034.1 DUF397 domain-containing protein [Candidatus Parcubacteria bacterium]
MKKFPVEDSDFVISGWCGKRPKCVQVAIKSEGVAVRNSNDTNKITLFFSHEEWSVFVKGVKGNEFNSTP